MLRKRMTLDMTVYDDVSSVFHLLSDSFAASQIFFLLSFSFLFLFSLYLSQYQLCYRLVLEQLAPEFLFFLLFFYSFKFCFFLQSFLLIEPVQCFFYDATAAPS